MPRPDGKISPMLIAKHVILSAGEESPVCSIVLNVKHAANTFARRPRRPFAFHGTTVREQAGQAFFPPPFTCQELRRADRNVRLPAQRSACLCVHARRQALQAGPTFSNLSSACQVGRRYDRRVSRTLIAKHVILSEGEESPVCSIVLNAKHAVNTFARRPRRHRGMQAHKGRPYTGNGT